VGAVLEQRCKLVRLLLEVDAFEQRAGRVAAAVRRHELEPVGERL
jgi:hypothetical protein